MKIRKDVGNLRDDAELEAAVREREQDRGRLLWRLRAERALGRKEAPANETRWIAAVHDYLQAAPSALLGVSLDDLAGESEPVNVPGVPLARYPSWQRRMREDLAALESAPEAAAVLEQLAPRARKTGRRKASRRKASRRKRM